MADGSVENPTPTGDGRPDYISFAAISVKLDGTNDDGPPLKEVVKCEHCHRPYHTKATCWKLHGKPADFEAKRAQRKTKTKANHTETVPAAPIADNNFCDFS